MATCPPPYAASATLTGSASPYGLHLTWEVYSTDTGKTYTVTLYQYRAYQDDNHVLSTFSTTTPQTDIGPILTTGWLYRAEITVAGIDNGSALRVVCVDVNAAQSTTRP